MKTAILIFIFLTQFLFCNSVSKKIEFIDLESSLEIKTSLIPKSGKGVFAKKKLEPMTVIGSYKGKFITEQEYVELVDKDLWQYVMWLKDCTKPTLGKYVAIDGRDEGSTSTRINYAPANFQNVKFEKLCESPYVIIRTLRTIEADEELYIDYGADYDYEFMKDEEIKKFFIRTK